MVSDIRKRLPLLIVGIIALAAVLFSVFSEVGLLSTWRMDRKQKQLSEENAGLREENAQLRAEIDRLRTNPAYIEEIARRELGLIGKQENVIVLERKKDAPPRDRSSGGKKRR